MTHAFTTTTTTDTSSVIDCERRLRIVLRANAANCTISGLALAVAPGAIDELLGTGHPGWVRLVGLALLVFAAAVAWLATTNRQLLRRLTPTVVAGDLSWVIVSVVTVFLGWFGGGGVALVLAMALVVDVFALLQFNAWRQLRRN